jgi:hypothetical protein
MYEEIEGGTKIVIQSLPCWIPPEGYVYNTITQKLEYTGVYSRSEDVEEQYWERIPMPDWYRDVMKMWDEFEKKKKPDDDTEFYDERLEDFKRQEWTRRLFGFWYMNNGKATYLVGTHYMYMQWWSIDIGYPRFRYPDLEYFYALQYCIEDPNCMGMLEITKRRFGKTFRGGLFVSEYVTRTKMTNGTIQSKTGSDAKKVFSKAIVNPFRKLPRFFRPEYDMSLGVNPKTELRFQKTNVRGKKAEENIDKEELGSVIDHHSADPLAQDGMKVHRSFQDEWAKTTECDIYARHEVMRYCVVDDEGRIIGKLLYSSTVEKLDSEKAGVQDGAKKLWDDSDQNKKGENGRTSSGLYRFFMSAKRAKNFDKYGFPNEEKTLKEIMADRETVKDNPRSLFARTRKEPITIEEAFSIDADQCIFNAANIAKREKELEENPVFKRKVWFYRDELTQAVRWRDITAREKDFHWEIAQFPPPGSENKFIMDVVRKPGRVEDGAIAIDGYSNSQGGQKWGSRASAWIGRRYDLFNPEATGKAIGHIYGRPSEKDALHDQVLLAAEYYGYQAYYEHNSDDYDSYFKTRGRRAYLGLYPLISIKPEERQDAVRHRGVPTTPFSLTKQTDLGLSYFENYCHQIDWQCLLDDAKDFDPNDRTKSDITVSFLILLLALNEPFKKPPPLSTPLIKTYPAIANSQNN